LFAVVVGEAELDGSDNKAKLLNFNRIKGVACGILAAYTLTSASFPVTAATQVLIITNSMHRISLVSCIKVNN
jgi:hypothetical protein